MNNIKVGVFFGGSSVEHEVSIISALQAIKSVDNEKYSVIPVYITKDGELYTGQELLKIENYKHMSKLLKLCVKVALVRDGGDVWLIRTSQGLFKNRVTKIDVAFPIVHGTNCEDGTLQGMFELFKLPFVGCDVLSSAIGMDKVVMKDVLMKNGVNVLEYVCLYAREWFLDSEKYIPKIEKDIGYPAIVKPSNLGSSVGISKVNDRKELEEGVELASSFSAKILVEKAIEDLREINCAVLGDFEQAYVSPCEEPIGNDNILSYADKYSSKQLGKGMDSAKRKLPASLDSKVEDEINKMALATFKALGCSGCARIDFLMDMAEDTVYVNEINTIPGSLSFYLWKAGGKEYKTLLDEMIELAFKRQRQKDTLVSTYDSNILAMGNYNYIKGAKGK